MLSSHGRETGTQDPKTPCPNTITLGARTSTDEFSGGNTDIQPIGWP